ncbi:hypothetical protein NKH77_44560 [Streptomyces sp. M19]
MAELLLPLTVGGVVIAGTRGPGPTRPRSPGWCARRRPTSSRARPASGSSRWRGLGRGPRGPRLVRGRDDDPGGGGRPAGPEPGVVERLRAHRGHHLGHGLPGPGPGPRPSRPGAAGLGCPPGLGGGRGGLGPGETGRSS